jgi:hypothetical protein
MRSTTILLVGLLLASCGGNGSSTPTASGPAPVIFDLNAALVAAACRVSGLPGTRLEVNVRFRDREGDVTTMLVTGTFDTGASFDFAGRPSGAQGITDGIASTALCVRFGAFSQSVTIFVALADAAGNSSNVESAVVRRPGTLRPRGIEESGAPSIRLLE